MVAQVRGKTGILGNSYFVIFSVSIYLSYFGRRKVAGNVQKKMNVQLVAQIIEQQLLFKIY